MLPSTNFDVAPCRPGADERSFWWPRICVRHGKVVKARGAARGARGDVANPVIGAAPRATRADSGGCRAHPPMKTFTTGSSSHAADALLL